jgi:Na+/glutamate symporter
MTSISLHVQWPLTSQTHGSFLKEKNSFFHYISNITYQTLECYDRYLLAMLTASIELTLLRSKKLAIFLIFMCKWIILCIYCCTHSGQFSFSDSTITGVCKHL